MPSIFSFRSLGLLGASVLLTSAVLAQAPNAFNYQAVVRDGSGELVTNAPVGVQISILQGAANGPAVYTETHAPTSNANGLVTLSIGLGTPTLGVFASIDWSNGPYFVETATDPAGGTAYSVSSVSEMLSVPYALHAANALRTAVYYATFPSQINNPPTTPTIVDFTSIISNSNADVFERLPTGEVEVKLSGMLTINVDLLLAKSTNGGFADMSININGQSRARNYIGPNLGSVVPFQNSCTWEVQAGDLISVTIAASLGANNYVFGNPWNKLNMLWVGSNP